MTLGEMYSVLWAATRDSKAKEEDEARERMYQLLRKIKGKA